MRSVLGSPYSGLYGLNNRSFTCERNFLLSIDCFPSFMVIIHWLLDLSVHLQPVFLL